MDLNVRINVDVTKRSMSQCACFLAKFKIRKSKQHLQNQGRNHGAVLEGGAPWTSCFATQATKKNAAKKKSTKVFIMTAKMSLIVS